MPPNLHPLLQRVLVSAAAGVAATGAVVATAKKPHRRKKRRRSDDDAPPREPTIGAQARKDARLPVEEGITLGEWADGVKALGARVSRGVSSFIGLSSSTSHEDEGGAREPDEIATREGTTHTPARASTGKKKARPDHGFGKGRRRRRKRRQEASLFDSAKESLRQVVAEETKKAVQEQVDKSGFGKAADAMKSVGTAVVDGVSSGAKVVKDALPPDFDDKAKEAGKAAGKAAVEVGKIVVEGAKKVGGSVGAAVQDGLAKLDADVSPSTTQEGLGGDDVARKAQDALGSLQRGVSALGGWLQGPGAPEYRGGRVRPSGSAVDVVEARETPREPAQASSPTSASSADAPPSSEQSSSEQSSSEQSSSEQSSSEQSSSEQSPPSSSSDSPPTT